MKHPWQLQGMTRCLPVVLVALALITPNVIGEASADDGTSATSYPRPSKSGVRLLDWLRDNGGVAHVEVVEISPGHRILVTDEPIRPNQIVVDVPSHLSIHSRSPHVQDLWLIREARRLNVYDDRWALQTYAIWASLPTTTTFFDPYFDSLPTLEDYRDLCDWTDEEQAELHMQPFEDGMRKSEGGVPFPTPSSPGLTWDNDVEWQNWQRRTQTILRAIDGRQADEFQIDRLQFARANMMITSREFMGGMLWPVLDMSDSNLASSAKFRVEVWPQHGRVASPEAIPKGTEVFTIPGNASNVAFLRSSCHAFPSNPYELVMLDVKLPPMIMTNKYGAQIVQGLMFDESPYEPSHPMDDRPMHNNQKNKRLILYMADNQTLRATVSLVENGVTALLSLARAAVFKGDLQAFESRERGRIPLYSADEAVAQDLAEYWLESREEKYPTSLEFDRALMQEIDAVQTLDRQGRVIDASKLASTGKLGTLGNEWDSYSKRAKLKNALIFRTQQKSIVESNLISIRNLKQGQHSEL